MSEGIKRLIECERRAKERLDEALKARENIEEQAHYDADTYMRSYIAQKEAELQALEEKNKAHIIQLSKSLEDHYFSFVEDMESRSVGELVSLIAAHITLQEDKSK